MSEHDVIARAVANSFISPGIRLAYVIVRLSADIARGFGSAVLQILKEQYPDQTIDVTPSEIGNKMMAIARRQLQNNNADAMDAVQDFLTYIITGTEYVEGEGEEGKVKRTVSEPWNFRKDFDTWRGALNAMYSNLKRRSMSRSIGKSRKKETGIEEAFGDRPEGGGHPEGGEAQVPDTSETDMSRALDDRAAIKEFFELMSEYIPLLESSLSADTKKLFDLIFYDEIGSFGSDIKENMGQAPALKEKYPDLYKTNEKRWSGFVGDLRKKLLVELEKFVETKLPKQDYEVLYEEFFSDTTPKEMERAELKKVQERDEYQRGIDERKIADYKWLEQHGVLPPGEQNSYNNLVKKFKKQNINVDDIQPKKPAAAKLERLGIPDISEATV
jgi:hypothetical protein